jgi:hypothetical protein
MRLGSMTKSLHPGNTLIALVVRLWGASLDRKIRGMSNLSKNAAATARRCFAGSRTWLTVKTGASECTAPPTVATNTARNTNLEVDPRFGLVGHAPIAVEVGEKLGNLSWLASPVNARAAESIAERVSLFITFDLFESFRMRKQRTMKGT